MAAGHVCGNALLLTKGNVVVVVVVYVAGESITEQRQSKNNDGKHAGYYFKITNRRLHYTGGI